MTTTAVRPGMTQRNGGGGPSGRSETTVFLISHAGPPGPSRKTAQVTGMIDSAGPAAYNKHWMVNPVSPLGGTLTPDDPASLNAIRRYEERLAKDPTSLAFAPLADAYRKGGRPGDAIRLCREGLERFPQYVTARLILAKALVDDGNPDGALDEVRAILATSPQEAQAHRLAGDLYRRAGALGDAVQHLEQAVRLDPWDPGFRGLLDVLRAGRGG